MRTKRHRLEKSETRFHRPTERRGKKYKLNGCKGKKMNLVLLLVTLLLSLLKYIIIIIIIKKEFNPKFKKQIKLKSLSETDA